MGYKEEWNGYGCEGYECDGGGEVGLGSRSDTRTLGLQFKDLVVFGDDRERRPFVDSYYRYLIVTATGRATFHLITLPHTPPASLLPLASNQSPTSSAFLLIHSLRLFIISDRYPLCTVVDDPQMIGVGLYVATTTILLSRFKP